MTRVRRILLGAALCLCVPLPALALTKPDAPQPSAGGPSPSAGAPSAAGDRSGVAASEEGGDLSVSVALDRCGLLATHVLCKLDVSFTLLPGAVRHTATVTRPDGSVAEFGELGPGVGSMWVPYAGDGTYLVEISAYGGANHPKGSATVLERERVAAGTEGDEAGSASAVAPETTGGTTDETDQAQSPKGGGEAGTSAGGERGGEPPAPACTEEIVAAAEAELEGLSAEQIATLEDEGLLPEGFACLDLDQLLAEAP